MADLEPDESQQQSEAGRAVQQERVGLFAAFALQADASPTIDSIPAIATSAIQVRRK